MAYTCGAQVMCIGGQASYIVKVKSELWERWNKINLQLQDATCKYLNVEHSLKKTLHYLSWAGPK